MDMFESMMAEKQAAARGARRREEERHAEWMREQQRARAPKLAGRTRAEKRRASMLDPMRYINQARQAAMHAQGQKGGFTGIGQLALKHEGERAAREAAQAYPMYAAMMGGYG
jgi:hypothetical protein